MSPPQHIVDLLKANDQDHVLAHWSSLSADQQKSLVEQIDGIDFPLLKKSLALSLAAEKELLSGSKAVLAPYEHVSTRTLRSRQDESEWREIGLDLIRKNKVAAITLAGGQGTRLGSSAPKGCYDIGLPSHKSLFQLQAERLLSLQRLACPTALVRWYVMTSPPTDAETRAFFEANGFFGLKKEQVFFFPQGALPACTPEGKVILANPGEISMAPDGNGGIFRALDLSGALMDMKKNGVECVDCVSVDNALVRPADPAFIGYCSKQGAEVGARVCTRRGPDEKVGVFVEPEGNKGGLAVREYSELGPEEGSATISDPKTGEKVLKFRWANLCMQFMSVAFLVKTAKIAAEQGSTYHVAWKNIPSIGGPVKGIKLEQFIFDPFPTASASALYEIERAEEFAPVKNAPGSAEDSPDTARMLLMNLHQKWVKAAGADVKGPIEISPLVSYAGEGLENYHP